jgi:hypothetical protein
VPNANISSAGFFFGRRIVRAQLRSDVAKEMIDLADRVLGISIHVVDSGDCLPADYP